MRAIKSVFDLNPYAENDFMLKFLEDWSKFLCSHSTAQHTFARDLGDNVERICEELRLMFVTMDKYFQIAPLEGTNERTTRQLKLFYIIRNFVYHKKLIEKVKSALMIEQQINNYDIDFIVNQAPFKVCFC